MLLKSRSHLNIDWLTPPSDDILNRIIDAIYESSAFGKEDVDDEVYLDECETTDTDGIKVIFQSSGGDCSEAWEWFNMILADQDSEIGTILREATMYGEEYKPDWKNRCTAYKKFEKAADQSSLTERTLEDGEELYQFLTDHGMIEMFFDCDKYEGELTEDDLGHTRKSHPIVARLLLEHRKNHPRKHEDDEDDD